MTKIALSAFVMTLALLPCPALAQSPPPAKDPMEAIALPPMDTLQATRERPLFSPTRQPDAPEEEHETQVVEEKPETLPFDLTGVVMGSDVAVAILRNRDTQETVHLKQGETVEEWSIEEIAQRHVVLRQDERQVTLELFAVKPEGSEDSPTPPRPQPVNRMMLPNRQDRVDPNLARRNAALQRRNSGTQRQSQFERNSQRQIQQNNQRRSLRRGNSRRLQND